VGRAVPLHQLRRVRRADRLADPALQSSPARGRWQAQPDGGGGSANQPPKSPLQCWISSDTWSVRFSFSESDAMILCPSAPATAAPHRGATGARPATSGPSVVCLLAPSEMPHRGVTWRDFRDFPSGSDMPSLPSRHAPDRLLSPSSRPRAGIPLLREGQDQNKAVAHTRRGVTHRDSLGLTRCEKPLDSSVRANRLSR
jgi:hypothetical protein